MIFARVAVNLPAVSGEFDYALPDSIHAGAGSLITVPFGSQIVQGVILGLLTSPAVENPRAALELLAAEPILTLEQIALARALAQQTLQPLALFIGAMIPAGLNQHADTLFTLTGSPAPEGKIAQRLFTLLTARGPLRGRQIDAHFARIEWRAAAENLVRRGWLKKEALLPPAGARPKFIRAAQLTVAPEKFAELFPTLGKTEATRARRAAALKILLREAALVPVEWLYAESGCGLADLQLLDEMGLIALSETEIFRDPLRKIGADELLRESAWAQLTAEQQSAWAALESALRGGAPQKFLLHGVTASGKTELYLRAARETLSQGKTALILVPEIALTPQLVRRFLARFPGQVGILHSKLSPGERYDTWRRVRSGALKILLGARSALFAPLPHLGLIVLDECHDSSYYQSEAPFYHALRAAPLYGEICGAVTIFGSATPPVETIAQARRGFLRLLELPRRVNASGVDSGLPPVKIVDMKQELQNGNRSIFSRALAESLAETLERGEQAILYLNRRGTATYVFCRDCGHSLDCPNCEIPLTQHLQSAARLICHRCGYSRGMPQSCPRCKSTQIRAYGLGSEKVEAEAQALLPQARILRWDADTTHGRDAHEIILTHFANHQADILVGTQMLAKGLDLPLVTLVGAVLADVGLTLPDPFAGERVFQLLTQVAGRAGRSARGGKVLLQTFLPENPIIQFAARHDFSGFCAWELENRSRLGYPPFARLARLEFRHREQAQAEQQAAALAARLRDSGAEVIGAAPCFFAKVDDLFRWQLIVRAPDPAALLRDFRLPEGWRVEVEPVNLL